MKYIFCLALLAGLVTGLTSARAKGLNAVDSVGVEKVGGKIFVLHRVNQGQTMFAVVRQYGTTIHALREANPGMSDQIQSGQTIRVPYTPKVSKKDAKKEEKKEEKKELVKAEVKETKPVVDTPAVATSTSAPSGPPAPLPSNGIHKVEPGQTLYRVAVKYGVLMADLRKWNNLTDDNLKDGQELIVSEKGVEKAAAPVAAPPAPKVATTVVKDSVKAKTAVPEKVVKPVEEVAPPKVVKSKRKSESGDRKSVV